MNLFDVLILAALAVFTVMGTRKGLIMTLCGLVVSILALVGAQAAADQLAPSVAYVIQPSIRGVIEFQVDQSFAEEAEAAYSFDLAPEEDGLLQQIMDSEVYQHFAQSVEESVQEGVQTTVDTVADSVASALAQSVAWLVVYIVAFVLILLLGNLLARVLNLAAALPGLHLLNKSLGGVCGLLKGAIVIAVVCSLGAGFGLIPVESIQSSALLGLFSAFSTISL